MNINISPLAVFNTRANVRHTLSPLNSAWRERKSGEALAEVYRGEGTVRVTLFSGERRADGTSPDTRTAYRDAWRALRLRRHDPADLLRELAQHKHLASIMGESLQKYAEGLSQVQKKRDGQRQHRRARHAAAIRAHRAALAAQRERSEESLRDCRRSLLDALNQRNAVASRIIRLQTMVTEARAKSPELAHLLRDLATDNIEQIVAVLLEHAGRAAEYHRRATAAEARASELHAGQQSLLAAARAAGFEYTVSAGAVRFMPVSAEAPVRTSD